jgi:choline/glycine/proline betaine transport protein
MPLKQTEVRSTILLPVFIPAFVLAMLLVIGTISAPELAEQAFQSTLDFFTNTFGWFYMLVVAFFLVFIVSIALTQWGHIKLGPDHAEPQYSFPAWFAMLFSAGYGIALLFFGVAEPILHFAAPPDGADPQTIEAARQAMQIAFFHWGFHIWAIYGLTGLVLAYFAFRHGLPLSMRSALYPLIGERIHGPIGHTVDVIAILSTLFGISTTLGLSVAQINAGLNHLWEDIPVGVPFQVGAIAVITSLAIVSVVAGMDKGIKRLSIINMSLVIALTTFVFIAGPTIHILESFLQNSGAYASNLVERTFNLKAYERSDWIGNWTLFIFAWTIAWAPFVGLFIAKISRGRTLRQFVFGVMLVPTLFTFFWFSVFGDTALHLIMVEGYTSLIQEVQDNNAVALFKMLDRLPMSGVVSFITVLLIITFFVTSSDSGSLVVDSLASGGHPNPPTWQRIFWASLEGIVAGSLLIGGGLTALQTMSITSALPFGLVLVVAAIGLWRALIIEGHRSSSLQAYMQGNSRQGEFDQPGGWKKRLTVLVEHPPRDKVSHFIQQVAQPAIERLADELRQRGWKVDYGSADNPLRSWLAIDNPEFDFSYEVRLCGFPKPGFAYSALADTDDNEREQYFRAEVFLKHGGQAYDVYGLSEREVINDVLNQLENHMHFLHASPGTLPWEMAKHDDMLPER